MDYLDCTVSNINLNGISLTGEVCALLSTLEEKLKECSGQATIDKIRYIVKWLFEEKPYQFTELMGAIISEYYFNMGSPEITEQDLTTQLNTPVTMPSGERISVMQALSDLKNTTLTHEALSRDRNSIDLQTILADPGTKHAVANCAIEAFTELKKELANESDEIKKEREEVQTLRKELVELKSKMVDITSNLKQVIETQKNVLDHKQLVEIGLAAV